MKPWLTPQQVADLMQLKDVRSARKLMTSLGYGRLPNGRYMMPREALEAYVEDGRGRINSVAIPDQRPASFSTSPRPRVVDPTTPEPLPRGWWRTEGNHG